VQLTGRCAQDRAGAPGHLRTGHRGARGGRRCRLDAAPAGRRALPGWCGGPGRSRQRGVAGRGSRRCRVRHRQRDTTHPAWPVRADAVPAKPDCVRFLRQRLRPRGRGAAPASWPPTRPRPAAVLRPGTACPSVPD